MDPRTGEIKPKNVWGGERRYTFFDQTTWDRGRNFSTNNKPFDFSADPADKDSDTQMKFNEIVTISA